MENHTKGNKSQEIIDTLKGLHIYFKRSRTLIRRLIGMQREKHMIYLS